MVKVLKRLFSSAVMGFITEVFSNPRRVKDIFWRLRWDLNPHLAVLETDALTFMLRKHLVREVGIEPTTAGFRDRRSPTELLARII